MSEGTQSAQRILRLPVRDSMTPEPLLLHRVDASQLQAPVYVGNGRIEELTEGEPLTLRKTWAIVGMALAAWAITGLVMFAAYKLAGLLR